MFRSLLARLGQIVLAAFFVASGVYSGEPMLGLLLAAMFLNSAGLDLRGVVTRTAGPSARFAGAARALRAAELRRRCVAALPWAVAATALLLVALELGAEWATAALTFYAAAWAVFATAPTAAGTVDAPLR
ncbi:MAG: hypothetical protein PGN13_01430 [Patulibacter minatonensis]